MLTFSRNTQQIDYRVRGIPTDRNSYARRPHIHTLVQTLRMYLTYYGPLDLFVVFFEYMRQLFKASK